ncbi:carboxymuconolactone decarboxylase family protein [Bacteroidota bacterium]
MSLTKIEKELVYVGASVVAGCKPCTEYHIKKAKNMNALDEEIKHSINIAMNAQNAVKSIMETYALHKLDNKNKVFEIEQTDNSTRIKELISIAATYAVNSPDNLKYHIKRARILGLPEEDIKSALDSAIFVKRSAEEHVNKIFNGISSIVLSIQNANEYIDNYKTSCDKNTKDCSKSNNVDSTKDIPCC